MKETNNVNKRLQTDQDTDFHASFQIQDVDVEVDDDWSEEKIKNLSFQDLQNELLEGVEIEKQTDKLWLARLALTGVTITVCLTLLFIAGNKASGPDVSFFRDGMAGAAIAFLTIDIPFIAIAVHQYWNLPKKKNDKLKNT